MKQVTHSLSCTFPQKQSAVSRKPWQGTEPTRGGQCKLRVEIVNGSLLFWAEVTLLAKTYCTTNRLTGSAGENAELLLQ
jgi:hypothetical protein